MENNDYKPVVPPEQRPARRGSAPSFFGPLLLIGAGVYFLLNNMGLLPALNWNAAFRLWPLLLILGGVNLIVRQIRRPFGTLLSFLVALATVALFGYLLLSPTLPQRLQPLAGPTAVQTEIVSYAVTAPAASVGLDFNSAGAQLYALQASDNLLEGEISYINELQVDWAENDDGRAVLHLDTDDRAGSVFGQATGLLFGAEDQWQIGLSPELPLALTLDLGSGPMQMDMADLQLESLTIDGGSGVSELLLPAGTYTLHYDIGSGATTVHLGRAGAAELHLDGGSGRLTLLVPAGVPVYLEAESGSGSLNLDDRFKQVDERDGVTIWETRGFDPKAEHITIYLDLGSGSVSSELP